MAAKPKGTQGIRGGWYATVHSIVEALPPVWMTGGRGDLEMESRTQ
jgi:hypothetical protein